MYVNRNPLFCPCRNANFAPPPFDSTYLGQLLTRPICAHSHHLDPDRLFTLGDLNVMGFSDRHRAVACNQRLRLRFLLGFL